MTASKVWASVVILGIVALTALAIAGNGKSDAAKRAAVASRIAAVASREAAVAAEANTRIVQQTSQRTECIRGVAAELDHGRWALVGQAFYATSRADARRIGDLLNQLPLITRLADHGGMVLGKRVTACPPAPTTKGTP